MLSVFPIAAASGRFTLGGDLPVRRLGYGAMRLTGPGIWGEPGHLHEAKEILRRTVELGINFIDTADSYGPEISERLIAETLHPYPEGLVIATKGGLIRPGPDRWTPLGHPDYLRQCVEMSLRRLRLERIDLYQLHRIDPRIPMEDSLGALKDLQRQGKIRHIGLSEVNAAEVERAMQVVPIVSVQNEYNLANRQSEETLSYCESRGLAFIPGSPVGSGKLTQPGGGLDSAARKHGVTARQLALAWLLQRSPVILPIPVTASVKHLEENTLAAELKLNAEEWSALESQIR